MERNNNIFCLIFSNHVSQYYQACVCFDFKEKLHCCHIVNPEQTVLLISGKAKLIDSQKNSFSFSTRAMTLKLSKRLRIFFSENQWEPYQCLKIKVMVVMGPLGGRGHCVLKQGFTQTFPRNQDVSVKLKSETIFIKFQYSFNVLTDPKSICSTQMIL